MNNHTAAGLAIGAAGLALGAGAWLSGTAHADTTAGTTRTAACATITQPAVKARTAPKVKARTAPTHKPIIFTPRPAVVRYVVRTPAPVSTPAPAPVIVRQTTTVVQQVIVTPPAGPPGVREDPDPGEAAPPRAPQRQEAPRAPRPEGLLNPVPGSPVVRATGPPGTDHNTNPLHIPERPSRASTPHRRPVGRPMTSERPPMPTRIETLTDAHRATFAAWTKRWIAVGHRTGPLTHDEWVHVEAAARKAYTYADLGQPNIVIGVASPLAGVIAASVAREVAKARPEVGDGVYAGVRAGVGAGVYDGVGDGVGAGVRAGVGAGVRAGVGAGVYAGVYAGVGAGVGDGVYAGVEAGVEAGVYAGVRAGVGAGVYAGVRARVEAGVYAGVGAGVGDGVYAGVGAGVGDGVEAGVYAGVYAGVEAGVGDGVEAGVEAGVGAGVGAGVDRWLKKAIQDGIQNAPQAYNQYRGGNLWCQWEAWSSWFRDVAHLDLPRDLPDRLQVAIDLTAAGWEFWYGGFCVITDRPTVLHVETVAGTTRMHCETGPAIAWADGFALHFWHGTRVPADLIETGWDTTRILQEPNSEIRRCAIERLGWDRFVTAAALKQVGDTVPDPGNPGQNLTLYDVPEQIYGDTDIRVLLCTNGTIERDGTRRRFGLTVPADITNPIAAAAWGYDITPELYATAARRA